MLKNNQKWLYVALLIVAPLSSALAADGSSSLSFFSFAPSAGDYSVTMLERVFGVVGNVLHGRGHQLFGWSMHIFNACWIGAIGIGILFVLWDATVNAAQNGEMMMGRAKRTVFKVIAIVIGFSLAIPSSTTGYSMAQNGVMWLVLQGVGLADRITDKMYSYFQSGGVAFTANPATADEMTPLMDPAGEILKSQICMFKLESILARDKQAQEDALDKVEDTLGSLPSYNYDASPAPVGYSINPDNTITVGTLADDATFAETGRRYNSECGTIAWSYSQDTFVQRMGSNSYTPEQAASEKAQTMTFIQTGVTQMFTALEPVARQIANIDPNAEDSEEQFYDIADSGASSLANSGVGFSTMIDPLRRNSLIGAQDSLTQSMASYNAKGWVFTPFMSIIPGLYASQQISVANYAPTTTPANLELLTQITDQDRQDIGSLMNRVETDSYVAKSKGYLALYQSNSYWNPDFSFNDVMNMYDTDDVDDAVDYLDGLLLVQRETLNFTRGFATNIIDGMSYVPYGLGWMIDKLGGNGDPLFDIQDFMFDMSDSIGAGIDFALDAMNDMIKGLADDIPTAKAGGMNNDLMELSEQIGPVGPVMVTLMTSMVGKGMNSLDKYAFQESNNAMVTSIKIGGDMMVAAMDATFAVGKVLFVTTVINGMISAVGEMVPNNIMGIPVAGPIKIFGKGMALANKGVDIIVPIYIALALFFFAGGLLLFILVPLSWVLLFGAVVLRWVGMVLINMVAAPVFCFNLIRSDGEGIIGRGERFLVDVTRTTITPAVLVLGGVAFAILLNIAFQMIALILTNFLPLLFQVHAHPYLVSVSLAAILMVFGVLMLYLTEMLGSFCTSDLVQAVGSAIGEALHHFQGAQGLHDQLKSGVSQAGGQASQPVKQLTDSAGGLKGR